MLFNAPHSRHELGAREFKRPWRSALSAGATAPRVRRYPGSSLRPASSPSRSHLASGDLSLREPRLIALFSLNRQDGQDELPSRIQIALALAQTRGLQLRLCCAWPPPMSVQMCEPRFIRYVHQPGAVVLRVKSNDHLESRWSTHVHHLSPRQGANVDLISTRSRARSPLNAAE